MIFSERTLKNTLKIREAQNNLDECKVKVSFYRPCCEESLETLTCVKRTFHLSRLIKTDVRSTMTDERFNHLCMLKHYKDLLTKECWLNTVMKYFFGRNEARVRCFGNVGCVK